MNDNLYHEKQVKVGPVVRELWKQDGQFNPLNVIVGEDRLLVVQSLQVR